MGQPTFKQILDVLKGSAGGWSEAHLTVFKIIAMAMMTNNTASAI
jgi:hypothetical protein